MSKYLPPFTAEERFTATGDRHARAQAVPSGLLVEPTGSEVTYADFLGEEVDE